jgi:glycosyltransferase involved in cell wall biosynthesis
LGHVPYAKLHSEFYSKIGVLLFPSVWEEPFALTVLEAMASGVLVIASNTGGTPEVVDSSSGYSFDPKVTDSLTQACSHVLKTSKENRGLIQQGAHRIRTYHSLPFMAKKVDDFIRRTLYDS